MLLYGLTEAGTKGWTDIAVLAYLVIGLALIFIFVLQQMQSDTPMLDMRVFKYSMFSLSTVISVLLTASMFAG